MHICYICYADIRRGIVYSFERDEGDCCFEPAWLGSPIKIGERKGILLSDSDALMENFIPTSIKRDYDKS